MRSKRIYTEDAHRVELIRAGRAWLVDVEPLRRFKAYLDTLPWLPSKIDWREMPPSVSINLGGLVGADQDAAVMEWLGRTRLPECTHLVVWYGDDQPGLACEMSFGIRHFDALSWPAWPTYYFGASRDGETWIPHFENFVEYDGGDVLTAALPAERVAPEQSADNITPPAPPVRGAA